MDPMDQNSIKIESADVAAAKTAVATDVVLKAPDFKALPTNVSDFGFLRTNHQIYVDKTALIAELVQIVSPVFVSRPRRFGKSLLCSTLADLFAHGTENFKGLAIELLWNEPTYPVLKLSFTSTSVKADNSNLDSAMFNMVFRGLKKQLVQQFLKAAHIDLEEYKQISNGNAGDLLSSVLGDYYDQTQKQFVIIIDEYDSLINQVIINQSAFEERVTWFSQFFNILKDLYGNNCCRFLFITGITRYAHAGILSGFNTLEDITYNLDYCILFGYTEEELQQYFGSYIEYGAQLCEISPAEYLKLLRQEYDGYSFYDSLAATKVYNPCSILKSFAALKTFGKQPISERNTDKAKDNVFDRFWASTGALSTYFVNFFKRQLQNVQTADNATLNDLIWFMNSDLTQDFELSKDLFYDTRNPYTMFNGKAIVPEFKVAMIQTGYYTFQVGGKSEGEREFERHSPSPSANKPQNSSSGSKFWFTVPNQEVAKTLNKTFWPEIKSLVATALCDVFVRKGSDRRYLIDEMFAGDADAMMSTLNERFVILSEKDEVFADEDSLCRQLANTLRIIMDAYDKISEGGKAGSVSDISSIIDEKRSPKGWADLFVQGKHKNVIFELKLYRGKGYSCDTLLQRALKQISKQRYYDQHPLQDTVCYAVVFSQKTYRVERLAVFELFSNGTYTEVTKAAIPLSGN